METVSAGKHNPRLRAVRKAFRQGALTPDGLLPVEGRRMVEEAVRSGLEIVEAFVRDGEPAAPAASCVYQVAPDAFRSLTATREPPGVVALVRPPRFDLSAMLATPSPLLVALCGVQDPGNAGTILRLAEAFGATGCVGAAGSAGQYNAKFVRATAGSLFRTPHVWDLGLEEFAAAARRAGIRLVGTGPGGAMELDRWDWTAPVAILIGSESQGLSKPERALCDTIVRIPHSPRVESLNAAAAAGVLLYEAARQRRRRGSE